MSTSPNRPADLEEIDDETRRILEERLKTFDEDVKNARPADEVLAEIRVNRKRQPPSPR
ncbi:MAG: hypothetical protein JO061_08320 [Acidobacteriaceae bacterium]|nr:hypothetical protein [Acidobacteriaceae bacterium]